MKEEIYNPSTFFAMCTCTKCKGAYSLSKKKFYELKTDCPFCGCDDFKFGATIVTEEGLANMEKYLDKKDYYGLLQS